MSILTAQQIGVPFLANFGAGANSSDFNSSTRRFANVFKTTSTDNIVGAGTYVADKFGGTSTLTIELLAVDSKFRPTGSALATGNSSITGGFSWRTITFGSPYTPTADTYYALVMSNTAGVPGTDYFRSNITSGGHLNTLFLGSTDGGATWDTPRLINCIAPRFSTSGNSNGVYLAGAHLDDAGSGGALYNVNTSRQAYNAVRYNFPYEWQLYAVQLAGITKTGSPNYDMVCEVIRGDTGAVLGTSIPINLPNNTSAPCFLFATPVTMPSGVNVYVAFRADPLGTVGDASNYYRVLKASGRHADASLPSYFAPSGGIASFNSTAWGTPSWSVYANGTYLPMAMYGMRSASGGGLILPQGMHGGFD